MHPINRTPGPILAFAEMDTLGPSWKLQKNQAQFLIQKRVLLLLPELFPSKTLRSCVSIFIFLESIHMFKKNKTVRWAWKNTLADGWTLADRWINTSPTIVGDFVPSPTAKSSGEVCRYWFKYSKEHRSDILAHICHCFSSAKKTMHWTEPFLVLIEVPPAHFAAVL